MGRLILFVLLIFCSYANAEGVYVSTFSVPAKCYDRSGFVDNCHVQFAIRNGRHYIQVADSRYRLNTCFSQEEQGTISTSFVGNKTRYWLTGVHMENNKVDGYQLVIFDPSNDGKTRIFYKTCPPNKSCMSESKYMYEISSSDWHIVFTKFIIKSTYSWDGGLNVAKTGDPFGDGMHLNQEAIK